VIVSTTTPASTHFSSVAKTESTLASPIRWESDRRRALAPRLRLERKMVEESWPRAARAGWKFGFYSIIKYSEGYIGWHLSDSESGNLKAYLQQRTMIFKFTI
jgi:hypothetical protein